MSVLLTSCNVLSGEIDNPTKTPVPTNIPVDTTMPIPSASASPSVTPSLPPLPTITPSPTPEPTPIINPTINDLYNYLKHYLATYSGDYGLYYYNLETTEEFGIRAKEEYIAASTSKVPINLYLYKLVANGEIDLETEVEYLEEDQEWGTGKIIFGEFGDIYTLRELSEFSITLSDNCAINMIIRIVGRENFITYMNSLGAVIDYHLYRTCPYDMNLYLQELQLLFEENPEVYGDMVFYLKNTIFNDLIPNLLPSTVEIAHKIGSYYPIPSFSDVGIIYTKTPYILAVMTNEVKEFEANEIIRQTSKIVYDFVTKGTLPVFEVNLKSMIPENILESARPYNYYQFTEEVIVDGEVTKYYFDNDIINFDEGSEYGSDLGVTTFRGNNYRDGGSYGTVDIQEEKLEIIWDFDIGIIVTPSGGYWPGVGWTGQPSIVNWDPEVLATMNVYAQFKNTNLKEVIYATLDGNIYFCDLETGEWTREPINMGYPTKGSVSIDERGYPILYTGQGINENDSEFLDPKFRMYDLTDQSVIYLIEGNDEDALRRWYSFDSSGLLDSKNDTFYELGENGIIYKIKLNTSYNVNTGELSLDPVITKFRYTNPFGTRYGFESSPVIYDHYLYATDNSGILMCIDLQTFKTMWIYSLGDDTDSSPALEVTEKGVYIYVATEVDRQGDKENEEDQYYPSYIRKFNALTGQLMWQVEYECYYDSVINGGVLGSPIIGKNDLEGLVIYSIAKTGSKGAGSLVALDKITGNEVWVDVFNAYSWSSPTAIYTPTGKGYILFCNSFGQMFLIKGITGEIKDTISLGANIEGTPAVYEDIAVVGSYAQKIFGIRIK